MTDYELILIAVKDNKELDKRVEDYVAAFSGKIDSSSKWGKRDFFYPIKKIASGFYFEYQLLLPANQIGPLKRRLDLDEEVLRYLLLKS